MPSIIDAIGEEFEAQEYTRIISLVPSITETLFAIGLENRIVGVTKWDVYPPHARNPPRIVIGGTKNPDLSLIKNLKPDLIIANKEETRKKTYAKLQDIAPVFVTYPRTIEHSIQMVETLIQLTQLSANSQAIKVLNSMKTTYEEHKKTIAPLFSHLGYTVFVPIWKDPWMTINHDTYINSMLSEFYLRNIFAETDIRYPMVDLSDIISAKPDLIILPDEPCPFSQKDKQFLMEKTGLETDRVILVEGSWLSWYGVRTEVGLKNLYISLKHLLKE